MIISLYEYIHNNTYIYPNVENVFISQAPPVMNTYGHKPKIKLSQFLGPNQECKETA